MPRLSVVMPVFNVASFVEEALRSLLAQTYRDLEIVVVDDGSTDETALIVEKMDDPRIRLLRAPHGGLVAAVERGMAAASGELVARADGDDVYLPQLFERQIELLDAHTRTVAVGAWARQFGGRQMYWRTATEPRAIHRGLRRACVITQPAVIRRWAYDEIGGLRRVRWEDWDLWIRLARRHDLRNVPDFLILYRFRPESLWRAAGRAELRWHNLGVRLSAARALGVDPRSAYVLLRNATSSVVYSVLDKMVPRSPLVPQPPDSPSISVVISASPNVGRLSRCLETIEAQEPRAEEVIAVFSKDQREAAAFLEGWAAEDPSRRRAVEGGMDEPLVALATGAGSGRASVIAYLGEDSIPRPDWLAEIRRGFLDPSVGAVGGRSVPDLDGQAAPDRTRVVGKVTWYGRVIGRHDRDTDRYGDVDFIGADNFAFRRALLENGDVRHERSNGSPRGDVFDACLAAQRLGYRVLFTPWAVVDQPPQSGRVPVSSSDLRSSSERETFALLRHLPAWRRVAFRVYAYGIGSSTHPGVLRGLRALARGPARARATFQSIAATRRGRAEGARMFRRFRKDQRVGRTASTPEQGSVLKEPSLPRLQVEERPKQLPASSGPRTRSGSRDPRG